MSEAKGSREARYRSDLAQLDTPEWRDLTLKRSVALEDKRDAEETLEEAREELRRHPGLTDPKAQDDRYRELVRTAQESLIDSLRLDAQAEIAIKLARDERAKTAHRRDKVEADYREDNEGA